MRDVLHRIRALAALPFRADVPRTLGVYLLMGAAPATQTLTALWAKLLTDGVVEGATNKVTFAAVAIGATGAFSMTAAWAGLGLLITLLEKTSHRIDQELIELTSTVPTLEAHERPEYLDRIEILRLNRQSLGGSFQGFMSLVATAVQMAITVTLLVRISPLLLLLPLFALPSMATSTWGQRIMAKALTECGPALRKARHLQDVATSAAAGKEVRIFGLASTLADTHDRVRRGVEHTRDRAGVRAAAISVVGWVAFSAGYAGALLLVLDRAVTGRATPGDIVLTLTLVGTLNQTVLGLIGTFGWFLSLLDTVGRLTWLRAFAAAFGTVDGDGPPAPARLEHGIRLEDVSFRYPDTEVDVLARVDLDIPAGSVIAVVGDNGAGKSTLVKLLTRMYDPSSGRITVDGVDLQDIDRAAWRANIAAGFQDFAHLEFVAAQAVGVGDVPLIDDHAAVLGALDRAGAREVLSTLDRGLDTQLGMTFDDGVELSGGQWQKLALGRAMMRATPVLLVLDEPTASLDAPTEHALFERYAGAATRVGRATGAITVLVSHRFSTVRMADTIVVIDGGGVRESGSHSELMALDGLYAELYGLQARGYR